MARRYCGRFTIYLACGDRDYTISVSGPGSDGVHRIAPVRVGFPAILEHAVDSPVAFDQAAHAALSFIQAEQEEDGDAPGLDLDKAAVTSSGWMITRKPFAELLRGSVSGKGT